MKYRFLNKIYAFINGYFWANCILCGQYFGGHERGTNCTLYFPQHNGMIKGIEVCVDCKKDVKEAQRKINGEKRE